jgi:hypothetical protein
MLQETKEYVALNAELAEIKKSYEDLVADKKKRWQELRTTLFQKLKESGQDSAKYKALATVSIFRDRKPVVVNEQKVIAWLKAQGLTDYYSLAPHLTELFYESVIPTLKDSAKVPDGIEIRESEAIRITPSKAENN